MAELPDEPIIYAKDNPFSVAIMRVAGYGLLFLAMFNLADILIPLRLMDSVWELETAGAIVESAPILVIATVLIFYGDSKLRSRWESFVVRVISSFCLLVAILFLILVPVVASNASRINQQAAIQSREILDSQLVQIDQAEEILNQSSNEEVVNFLLSQGVSLEPEDSQDIKQVLVDRFAEQREQLRSEHLSSQERRRQSLAKNTVKWIAGALVSSLIFIYVWRLTKWARIAKFLSVKKRRNSNSSGLRF